jgi:hypothetical protein
MTVVASAGEGDGQDAHGERLVRGVDYVPDSFDASEDEDNGVEVESARGEARIRGVNYVPDWIDASEDDDNGVEVDSVGANDDMMKLDLGESVVPCSPLFHASVHDAGVELNDKEEDAMLALEQLMSRPEDVFMSDLCKHKAFMDMGPLLLPSYFGAADVEVLQLH